MGIKIGAREGDLPDFEPPRRNTWQTSEEEPSVITTQDGSDRYAIEKKPGTPAKLSRSRDNGQFAYIGAFDTIEEAQEAVREIASSGQDES
jgi:hypothetical protein